MNNSRKKTTLIVGTGVLLIVIFLAMVLMFFIFSSFSNVLVGQCVAVVDINNELTIEGVPPSLFDPGLPSSEEIAYAIKDLDSREDVGAVVLVMNSPGGSVVATREIYDSVNGLDKPSVAYFREVAASGAYYVATGTDYIVSDPDALTGSIGVVATMAQMSGLLEKIGVNVTTVKSGEYKDIGSPFRNASEREIAIMQGVVDEIYQEFRSVILVNRKGRLDLEKFDEVSDGRILTGRQAKKVGLVDELGNKEDAILKAAQLAGIPAESIDDVRVCYVSTMSTEGGLFSAQGILRSIEAGSQVPSVSYK